MISGGAIQAGIGVSAPNFYKTLSGERKWTIGHLEKVAAGLNVSISSTASIGQKHAG